MKSRVAGPATSAGFLLASLLPLVQPAPLASQIIRGQVLDSVTGAPVAAVLVELLDAEGRRVEVGLSAADGSYELRVADGGSYRVGARRIGYATTQFGPFEIPAEGVAVQDLELPTRPFQVRGIVGRGSGRCVVDPAEGVETARLWDEARSVLEVTALVHERELIHYDAVRFQRVLGLGRRTLWDEDLSVGPLLNPFASPPAAELVEGGFVRSDDDGSDFFMPDPSVILSRAFLDTHCFRTAVRRGPAGDFVGLSFEPLPSRRAPDVSGVLWLNRADGALHSLEYAYEHLGDEDLESVSGGRAEFEQLATGVWIVRRWWISMPQVEEVSRFLGLGRRIEVVGIREEGGEVVQAFTPGGELLTRTDTGRIAGFVHDSVRSRPLAGARVRLSGTLRATATEADGGFVLERLTLGEYVAVVEHPFLDTLGIPSPGRVVHVPGTGEPLRLSVPSRPTILEMLCPDMDAASGVGILNGRVFDEQTGHPVSDARVRLSFVGGDAEVTTGPEGRFRLCGVPPSFPLHLEAEAPGGRTARGTVEVPRGGFGRLDLALPAPALPGGGGR